MQTDQAKQNRSDSEVEHLLHKDEDWMEMAGLRHDRVEYEGQHSDLERVYSDGELGATRTRSIPDGDELALTNRQHVVYRVYKIRWFGLTQLILLNIIVSWDVSRIVTPIQYITRTLAHVLRSGSPTPPSPTQPPISSPQTPASSTGSAPVSSSPS